MLGKRRIKVYSGLSLSAEEIHAVLPTAEVCPPVARGDLRADASAGYHVVAIIDGTFHHGLAVSISEIMDALRCGVTVWGSSSMGALRAADLAPYGMHGHGEIFDLICSTAAFRDDYLGQSLAQGTDGIRALSQPWVDFYFNLMGVHQREDLALADLALVCKLYGDLDYSERCLPALRARLTESFPDRPELQRLAVLGCNPKRSQKTIDGLGMLRAISDGLARVDSANALLEPALAKAEPEVSRSLLVGPRAHRLRNS